MSSFFKNRFATVILKGKEHSGSAVMPVSEHKSEYKKQKIFGLIVLFILLCVSVWSIMGRVDLQEVPRLVLDQEANTTIYAAVPFSYVDKEETEQLHREILSKCPLFFRIHQEDINKLKSALGIFKEEQKDNFGYDCCEAFAEKITIAANRGLISSQDMEKYRNKTFRFVDALGRRIVEQKDILDAERPEDAAREIAKNITYDFFKEKKELKEDKEKILRLHAIALLSKAVMHYDQDLTGKENLQAVRKAGQVQYEYNRGDLLLRKGVTVSKHDINRLESYSKELKKVKSSQKLKTDWIKLLQSTCIAFLLILFTAIYVIHIHPEVIQNGGAICALGLIILTALLLNILFIKLFSFAGELFSIPPKLWYLALPLGFAPIVIGTLIGVRIALFSGLFIALVSSFSGMNQFNMVVFGMVVSALSSYMIKGCRNYKSLFLRGFFTITIVSMILVVVFCWRDNSLLAVMPWPFVLPVAISTATIVLVQFALFLLEGIFDLSSKISLNLYSDYNHPLLKVMQINAPGTYHHSLVVSMLAEAAAEAIGADPIKARVGALFHDVGKTVMPKYFTENGNGENPHDELTPKDSALVITNHIREGMKLAREYKLKRPIREAIEQHHGTDLVYYFYKQAKDSGECINEQDFRYSGPCPRSKEIAIISLADACEAASRSLDKPSLEQISEMVSAIIQKRLRDGQLDECALTFRELTIIRESFIKSLTSMLHARIAYPNDKENENEDDLFVDAERKASAKENS